MKRATSVAALQRDRGQLQARDPTFGTSFQGGDVVRREVQAHHLVEKVGGLGRGEAKVGGAQFGQLASGAQSGEGQSRILTGGDDQVHLRRLVLDQEGQGVVDRLGVEDVVVVENEHDIARDGGDVVEQGRQRRLEWRGLRRLEHRQHPVSNPGRHRLQRRDQIGQETARIAVAFVERQPRHRAPAARDPFADQGGLAKAGWGGDQGQLVAGSEAFVQPLDQSRTEDDSLPRRWDVELGGQDRRGHLSTIGTGATGFETGEGTRTAGRAHEPARRQVRGRLSPSRYGLAPLRSERGRARSVEVMPDDPEMGPSSTTLRRAVRPQGSDE